MQVEEGEPAEKSVQPERHPWGRRRVRKEQDHRVRGGIHSVTKRSLVRHEKDQGASVGSDEDMWQQQLLRDYRGMGRRASKGRQLFEDIWWGRKERSWRETQQKDESKQEGGWAAPDTSVLCILEPDRIAHIIKSLTSWELCPQAPSEGHRIQRL